MLPHGHSRGAKTSHDGELNLVGNLRLGRTRRHPRSCGVPGDVQADVLHSLGPDLRLFLSVEKFFMPPSLLCTIGQNFKIFQILNSKFVAWNMTQLASLKHERSKNKFDS